MFILRRWWERHGLQLIFISVALGSAWTIQQTQGAVLSEIYHWVTRPFHTGPTREERITNARILELQERLTEQESQNQKLKELLGYINSQKPTGIFAPIIGRSADHWWQQLTIGRGKKDGIQEGAIVSAPGGLIGRVIALTDHTSRVLLITDPTSQVGVTISRSRAMGFMRGQAADYAVIEFFDKVPDVRPGDTISTSAFSQLFPAGLPVGRVESVDMSKSPAPEAVVRLTAPISHLEWVVVQPNYTPPLKNLPSPVATPSPEPTPKPETAEP